MVEEWHSAVVSLDEICVSTRKRLRQAYPGFVMCALDREDREDRVSHETSSYETLFRPTSTMVLAFCDRPGPSDKSSIGTLVERLRRYVTLLRSWSAFSRYMFLAAGAVDLGRWPIADVPAQTLASHEPHVAELCLVVGAVYFYDLNLSDNNGGYVFTHPVTAAKFYFLSIGDVSGLVTSLNPDARALMVLGLVIFLMACWLLISFGSQRDKTSGAPFGDALIAAVGRPGKTPEPRIETRGPRVQDL